MDELLLALIKQAQANKPKLPIGNVNSPNLSKTPFYDEQLAKTAGPLAPLRSEGDVNATYERDMKIEDLLLDRLYQEMLEEDAKRKIRPLPTSEFTLMDPKRSL